VQQIQSLIYKTCALTKRLTKRCLVFVWLQLSRLELKKTNTFKGLYACDAYRQH